MMMTMPAVLRLFTVTFVSFWVLALVSPWESFSAQKSPSRGPASDAYARVSTSKLRSPVARDERWLMPRRAEASNARRFRLLNPDKSFQIIGTSSEASGAVTGPIWNVPVVDVPFRF